MSRQGLFRLFVWIEVVNDPNKLKVINLVCCGQHIYLDDTLKRNDLGSQINGFFTNILNKFSCLIGLPIDAYDELIFQQMANQ